MDPASPANGTNLACDTNALTLADVIERVESSSFLAALRFEPATYAGHHFDYSQITPCQHGNLCNRGTARILLSMSFGLYQIMGFNLYDPKCCGYEGSIGDFLASKLIQRKMLSVFLAKDHLQFTPHDLLDLKRRNLFAERYNGPGNVIAYSQRVFNALHELGVQ